MVLLHQSAARRPRLRVACLFPQARNTKNANHGWSEIDRLGGRSAHRRRRYNVPLRNGIWRPDKTLGLGVYHLSDSLRHLHHLPLLHQRVEVRQVSNHASAPLQGDLEHGISGRLLLPWLRIHRSHILLTALFPDGPHGYSHSQRRIPVSTCPVPIRRCDRGGNLHQEGWQVQTTHLVRPDLYDSWLRSLHRPRHPRKLVQNHHLPDHRRYRCRSELPGKQAYSNSFSTLVLPTHPPLYNVLGNPPPNHPNRALSSPSNRTSKATTSRSRPPPSASCASSRPPSRSCSAA